MINGFKPGAPNPKDPLANTLDTPQKELARQWGQAASGFGYDAVIVAASSMLVTGVRQCYPTLAEAEARLEEVVGKSRQALRDCYDSTTGKRRNIFPHTQIVQAAHHDDDKDTLLNVNPQKRRG